jgi:ABC-type Zn uptake system ZnuABC Zn-binding protein ZnuA
MAPYRNRKVIVYHKQWEYLVDWLGLSIVEQIEPKPGIPPSPKHIASLIQLMRVEGIQVVLSSNSVSTKASKQVANKAGAKLVILPTSVGGEKSVKTYTDLFEHIVSKLESAFGE